MSQNTSSAVMAQRQEARDSLDDFPTPPWAVRALLEMLFDGQLIIDPLTCWEPACNRGHMVGPLKEFFTYVRASDVHDYQCGYEVLDFLYPTLEPKQDWVITNPPFRLADQFIARACQLARRGVAMFVRTQFLEGIARFNTLFSVNPPTMVCQFTERVVIHRGRLVKDGSSATAYCWLVWEPTGSPHTRFRWIPPCRRRLERPEDYLEAA